MVLSRPTLSLLRPLALAGLVGVLVACGGAPADPAAVPAATPAAPVPASPAAPAPAVAPAAATGRVVLAPGQSAEAAPGVTLTFVSVTADSRCKDGQQCAWAGEVRLALRLTTAKGAADFELASSSASVARVHRKEVELLGYGPCPDGNGECASLRIGK